MSGFLTPVVAFFSSAPYYDIPTIASPDGIGRVEEFGYSFKIHCCVIAVPFTPIGTGGNKHSHDAIPAITTHTIGMGCIALRLPEGLRPP